MVSVVGKTKEDLRKHVIEYSKMDCIVAKLCMQGSYGTTSKRSESCFRLLTCHCRLFDGDGQTSQ